MARSRGRAAPVRSAPVARSAPPAPVSHAPSTPAAHAPPPAPVAAAPQQPGLFAQMASTAAGVAVGSAVGHTIGAGLSGIFSGGSSAPAEPAQQAAAPVPASQPIAQTEGARVCDVDARQFTRCLEDNNGNMQICDWYLQQLKACQQAAGQY